MGYDAGVLHNSKDITQCVKSQHLTNGDYTLRVEERAMNADDIIRRMRQVYDAKNDSALAAALNLAVSAPSNWRQRNSPPLAICANIAETQGISLDWLIFGVGNMRLGVPVEATEVPGVEPHEASPAAHRVTRFVYVWDATRSHDEMVWLEQQIKRTVPEYGEWLASSSPRGTN